MIAEQTFIRTNEELFIHLYKTAFPKVALFVKKMGGSFEEAKDIFQDALLIYYEKEKREEAQNESNYISGIARNLWYKHYREKKNLSSLNTLADLKSEEEELKVSDKLLAFVEVSGKKCMELLKSFYYDKMNMKDLSEKFGFSGERSATAQKFKCLEKVRNTIKHRAITKEDFYE